MTREQPGNRIRTIEVTIRDPHGLHARPAALFVRTAAGFASSIHLRKPDGDGREINAKSIMEVMTAGIDQGSRVEILAEGDDAEEAVHALAALIQGGPEAAQ